MKLENVRSAITLGPLWIVVAVALYLIFLGLQPEKILGDAYRIFFFEFPSAILAYVAFTITLGCSVLYLKNRNLKWDEIGSSSARLGLVFTSLTLITGSIFANETWGAYWNWDPIQTTTLILWFLYAFSLSARSMISNKDVKARISSALGILAFAGVPLTYISTRVWPSLHPTSISLEPAMWVALLLMLSAYGVVYLHILRYDIKLQRLSREYERLALLAKKRGWT